MDKPVCNDDSCIIEETECCGPKNGNYPESIEEDDNGLIPKPDGPGPENKPSCCGGGSQGNWPDPDRNPDDRPVDETECGGPKGGNGPHYPDDKEGWKKPCGGKKPTPGGPMVTGGGISCEGNWPDRNKYPDEDKYPYGWKKPSQGLDKGVIPHPHLGPVGGPHIPIKDPHEGMGPYRVIGPILDGKEPGDGSGIGPRPI